MKLSLFILLLFSFSSFRIEDIPQVDKEEAKKAFERINQMRADPKAYSKELKISLGNVKPQKALRWNDTLALVAEQRALDMAKRNYFSHVDPSGYAVNYYINKAGYTLNSKWIKNKRENDFESLQAGAASAEEAVKNLIIDQGVSGYGHRKHLLGVGEWNASLVDIGIGFVRAGDKTKFTTYTCVIIAKHDW